MGFMKFVTVEKLNFYQEHVVVLFCNCNKVIYQ